MIAALEAKSGHTFTLREGRPLPHPPRPGTGGSRHRLREGGPLGPQAPVLPHHPDRPHPSRGRSGRSGAPSAIWWMPSWPRGRVPSPRHNGGVPMRNPFSRYCEQVCLHPLQVRPRRRDGGAHRPSGGPCRRSGGPGRPTRRGPGKLAVQAMGDPYALGAALDRLYPYCPRRLPILFTALALLFLLFSPPTCSPTVPLCPPASWPSPSPRSRANPSWPPAGRREAESWESTPSV